MYDAILISTHYGYDSDGQIIPAYKATDHDDLSMIIPLGIIHIAQYLHDCGFNARVVHLPQEMHALRRFGLSESVLINSIEKILRQFPARICGIQVHWYLYCGGAVYIAKLYKKIFPDSSIFIGGFMAAAYWREFLKASTAIDGVVVGEGETPFRKLLEKKLKSPDGNLQGIEGIAGRSGTGELYFSPAGVNANLPVDDLPIIRPDAAPFAGIIWPKRHFINISRGVCPEKCSYCLGNSRTINSRIFQTLKINKVIEQIRVYQDCGIQNIFLGENHFLSMPFMMELIEQIIRENFNIYFELETHPRLVEHSDLLNKMIEAKFLKFTMGCESGSNAVLKRMGRQSNSSQIVNSVRDIAQRGGIVLTSWISNLPGETESEFRQTQNTMHAVVQAGGFIYWIENLHVLPGTKLYQNPDEWDIEILLKNLSDWNRWSLVSKQYVAFDIAAQNPLKYLTHLNRNTSSATMIQRFYSNRKLAVSLIPEMKLNLERNFKYVPTDIFRAEMQFLDWYARKGWKLWLF